MAVDCCMALSFVRCWFAGVCCVLFLGCVVTCVCVVVGCMCAWFVVCDCWLLCGVLLPLVASSTLAVVCGVMFGLRCLLFANDLLLVDCCPCLMFVVCF